MSPRALPTTPGPPGHSSHALQFRNQAAGLTGLLPSSFCLVCVTFLLASTVCCGVEANLLQPTGDGSGGGGGAQCLGTCPCVDETDEETKIWAVGQCTDTIAAVTVSAVACPDGQVLCCESTVPKTNSGTPAASSANQLCLPSRFPNQPGQDDPSASTISDENPLEDLDFDSSASGPVQPVEGASRGFSAMANLHVVAPLAGFGLLLNLL